MPAAVEETAGTDVTAGDADGPAGADLAAGDAGGPAAEPDGAPAPEGVSAAIGERTGETVIGFVFCEFDETGRDSSDVRKTSCSVSMTSGTDGALRPCFESPVYTSFAVKMVNERPRRTPIKIRLVLSSAVWAFADRDFRVEDRLAPRPVVFFAEEAGEPRLEEPEAVLPAALEPVALEPVSLEPFAEPARGGVFVRSIGKQHKDDSASCQLGGFREGASVIGQLANFFGTGAQFAERPDFNLPDGFG